MSSVQDRRRRGRGVAEEASGQDGSAAFRGVGQEGSGLLRKRREKWHWGFLSPALITLGVLAVAPLLFAFYLSISNSSERSAVGDRLLGFGQYAALLGSGTFWSSVKVESIFLTLALTGEVVVGTAIALLLNAGGGRLTRFVRSLLLAPVVLPTITVALLFSFLLQPSVGAISYYLGKVGIANTFLDHPLSAIGVIVALDMWQYIPFVAILVLAGLQGISPEYLEAARVDGAGVFQQARYVTLPVVAPVIWTVALLRFLDAVQVFPTIYVLTGGGPGTATTVLNYLDYRTFFVEGSYTAGAAAAVLLAVGCVGLGCLFAGLLRKQLTV